MMDNKANTAPVRSSKQRWRNFHNDIFAAPQCGQRTPSTQRNSQQPGIHIAPKWNALR